MREYRAVNPWRGVTAVVLIAAATVIAALYGIMAVVILNKNEH
ncbi:hypothetical protein V6615_10085 [Oscillospiraceae bacterium PP1C4]